MQLVFQHSYGDESYGLVYRLESGSFAVYEVPQYGGEEQLYKEFGADELDAAVACAKSFV